MVKNHSALVLGGSDRIGRAVAEHFHRQGFSIALHYLRDREGANETSRLCGDAPTFQGDLRREEEIDRIYEEVFTLFSHVDVVVNCASVFQTIPFSESGSEQWDAEYALHVRSAFLLTQKLHARVEGKDQKALIIHFGDASASLQVLQRPLYALSKSALMQQIAPLALLSAPEVRVNAIAPGLILYNDESERLYFEKREKQLPLKRLAALEEILMTCDFLIANCSITGQVIYVDGGENLL
ncbi:MAG: SDR family oxidoreductase [Sphaerochaetaceae bacterium]|nr:SDR family oxidoreductase [Sphaerochaetaceae bacterium]